MRKGYVHIYTGSGKGKTTAALGLALRSAGAGHRVFFAQFIKKTKCSEHKALERFSDLVTLRQFGTGFIRGGKITEVQIKAAATGIEEARKAISSSAYDVVILDEINIAVHYGLVAAEDVLSLIEARPSHVEILLTGRYADKRLIEKADLITEMKEVRHYMNSGVKARKGIEF
ncbi:MAG TPA: cob(I)yrinic acid a,c-diamide adenosyltransferase [Dissulfurispiraceae bacterium]|nr:cob(I)yrinic acid a,c-diamide adenosyltransferase [Dissulfurispiraceae bacterium]